MNLGFAFSLFLISISYRMGAIFQKNTDEYDVSTVAIDIFTNSNGKSLDKILINFLSYKI